MARLREQRNLIRLLCEKFPESLNATLFQKDPVRQLGFYLGGAQKVEMMHFLMGKPIFLKEKEKDVTPIIGTDTFKNVRLHKAASLFQSCVDDQFIIQHQIEFPPNTKANETNATLVDAGVRVTSRGTDLLHLLGFLKISLEKYDKVTLFLTSTIVTGLTTWLLTSTPKWLCLIKALTPILSWCYD